MQVANPIIAPAGKARVADLKAVDATPDYSHGIRLVYRKIKVAGKWMGHTDVLKHLVLHQLLCNEQYCDFYKYTY